MFLVYFQDRYDEAIEYYDRTLAVDPNDSYALASKADSLRILLKDMMRLRNTFDRALAIDPILLLCSKH